MGRPYLFAFIISFFKKNNKENAVAFLVIYEKILVHLHGKSIRVIYPSEIIEGLGI